MSTHFDVIDASAGSGKTSALIKYIEGHLDAGIPIEKIAMVTFTRHAALVARTRIAAKLGLPPHSPKLRRIQTIHSMCFAATHTNKLQMLDNNKFIEFGKIYNFNTSAMFTNKRAQGLLSVGEERDMDYVGLYDLQRNNPQMFADKMNSIKSTRFSEYTKDLYEFKQQNNYRDFSDLLQMYLKDGLVEDVEIACWDEMQDSTPLQWQVLMQAFRKCSRIYIAGDVRQGLYDFAGADMNTFRNFRGDRHPLNMSYRVPETILSFVNEYISPHIYAGAGEGITSYKTGGVVHFQNIGEDIGELPLDKDIFMLAWVRRSLTSYVHFCRDNGYIYDFMGVPSMSETKYFEYQVKENPLPEERAYVEAVLKRYHRPFQKPRIHIATIHYVKGDEADIVYLKEDTSSAIARLNTPEVQSKVFYVGATRAKEKLVIVEHEHQYYYKELDEWKMKLSNIQVTMPKVGLSALLQLKQQWE